MKRAVEYMSDKMRNILRWCVFALAIAFIVYGIYSGECAAVLKKATNVCLECIGIG